MPPPFLQHGIPGVEGGTAIARTLAGLNNPAGRLPVTFYAGLDGLPAFTDYTFKGRTYRYFAGKPLWGFGYGLSYSSFKYGPVKLSSATIKAGDPITATVTVSNAGAMSGDEVVQAYVKTPQEGGPIHSLVGFERVTIAPGASKEVTLTDRSPLHFERRRSGQPLHPGRQVHAHPRRRSAAGNKIKVRNFVHSERFRDFAEVDQQAERVFSIWKHPPLHLRPPTKLTFQRGDAGILWRSHNFR